MAAFPSLDEQFEGRRFGHEVIVACVRCALQAQLRDLTEIMAERGLLIAQTTIMRWVPSRILGAREGTCLRRPCVSRTERPAIHPGRGRFKEGLRSSHPPAN
jgi:hypothetical protein